MLSILFVNVFVVALSVIIHYEFLYRITIYIPKMNFRYRYRIVFGVFGALVAHSVEIWIFAVAYFLMNKSESWGTLQGNLDGGTLLDCVYFSSTVFTTLGFGDIEATGNIRYLTGFESLTGLVLITWTASFLYFEMQRHWGEARDRVRKH
ncbi:MAG: potassium channel family protein [Gammaproteobacteria bacterium]|nr:potassium channel family protein [Gammaproteobacteria bacterium]MBT8150655.1 potassium channel family protein [Gammaproteobacteria bacterium]NND39633.1 two pore domain potassium channel family protein [Pseudomonadales bacterium]NNM11873.1 two pore domain potassium channel family protein [Pseudomonadales bacterium]RZV57779.1 MAG: two pore domain potassium channel family protein [Pseudomonadales bacterium]